MMQKAHLRGHFGIVDHALLEPENFFYCQFKTPQACGYMQIKISMYVYNS